MFEEFGAADGFTVMIDGDAGGLKRELDEAGKIGQQFARSLGNAFEGLTLKGRGLGDVVRSLAQSLSQIALRAAFEPLENALGNAISGLFSGGFGAAAATGIPVPFAHGGVIASPVAFPLAGGRTGLAGERGAEAIMPLARGPDGRLGVVAAGGGGAISIQFNVTTPDADSFRRSEGQIAAQLARAVGRGQRNL
jgi:phage-related minor tail protein